MCLCIGYIDSYLTSKILVQIISCEVTTSISINKLYGGQLAIMEILDECP